MVKLDPILTLQRNGPIRLALDTSLDALYVKWFHEKKVITGTELFLTARVAKSGFSISHVITASLQIAQHK